MYTLKSFVLFAILGLAYSQSCNNVEVQNLVVQDGGDGSVVAEWTATSNADCEYEITFSSNVPGGSDFSAVTTERIYIFENVVPCSTVTITVARVGGTSVSASLTTEISVKDAPVLNDMTTSCDSIQMIWEAQPYNQNMCEVTHFQMLCTSATHNFSIPQMVTDVEHRTFNILITVLRPDVLYTCNGFMFTTLGGFSDASEPIEFWSNLDMVRDLKVEETQTSLAASWEPPLNSEECGVAYDVTYENEVLGSSTVEVVGLSYDFDIDLISCTDYTISVVPISFTGSRGTSVSVDITPSVRVGQVSNLEVVDNSDSLVLRWNALDVGRCGVSYVVRHLVNGEVYASLTTSDTDVEFERITCATSSFTVQAFSEGLNGSVASEEAVLDVGDITRIDQVSNVRLEGGRISWDAPGSIGFCSISYIVEIENIFGQEELLVSDTSVDVDLIPCSANKVTVTGVSGDVNGAPGVFEIEAPIAEFSAPVHVRTNPGFTTADITLRADSINDNLCVISAVDVECSNDNGDSFERTLSVDDNNARFLNLVLEDLELDTIYTCAANVQGSSSDTQFAFRTIPLSQNILTISNVNQNGFTVSWTEEYGKQFVNGYNLVVESHGPQHAVPDNCDIERGAVFTFQLSNTDLSQVFIEGFADYGYTVTLTTSYTLGISIWSEQYSTQTLTGVPGSPEDLSVEWVQNDDNVYNVSAVLVWNTPCSLNGRLRAYSLVINAEFLLNGQSITVGADGEVNVDENVVNAAYDYEISDINPFFTYNVYVYPEAASVGEPAVITFTPPDACACN